MALKLRLSKRHPRAQLSRDCQRGTHGQKLENSDHRRWALWRRWWWRRALCCRRAVLWLGQWPFWLGQGEDREKREKRSFLLLFFLAKASNGFYRVEWTKVRIRKADFQITWSFPLFFHMFITAPEFIALMITFGQINKLILWLSFPS